MSIRKETPEKDRERLYCEEKQNHLVGNFNDNLNRIQTGIPNITGMSAKEIEVLILIILKVFIVYSIYKLF